MYWHGRFVELDSIDSRRYSIPGRSAACLERRTIAIIVESLSMLAKFSFFPFRGLTMILFRIVGALSALEA
jgi:hypothetical protein